MVRTAARGAWLSLGLLASFPVSGLGAGTPPNILFILADDLGWTDAAAGSDFYETPHLDRFMTQGMRFTSAYANGPNCAPTRASLMSGLYGPRHGVYTVRETSRGDAARQRLATPANATTLAASFQTLAESLHAGGYATFHGGKWHLGDGDLGPLARGFDVNVGGSTFGAPPGATYFGPWPAPGLENAPAGAHLADYVTDRAIDFIRERRDRPFFAYVAYYDVHTPLHAKEELVRKYEEKLARHPELGRESGHHRPVYAAMVETLDTNVGRLLQALAETGLADNTLVIFTSDNGGFGNATAMRPLRGAKGMLYEGGIRVPLGVVWPGRVAPGSTSDEPVISLDFYPTLLEAAGVRPAAGLALDGVSLLPIATGRARTLGREAVYWHFPAYLDGVPKGFAADVHTAGWRETPCSAVRAGEWKLIEHFEDGSVELYHLAEDIGERRNLAAARPEKAAELQALLARWREATAAPMPVLRAP
jgi:arylsulfatase A-like enzyme